MKLVQFENGEYGVRTNWFFGWRFLDLKDSQHRWRPSDGFFCDCKGSEEEALSAMKRVRAPKYRVIE